MPISEKNTNLKFKALRLLSRITKNYPPQIDRFLRLIYSPDKRQLDHIQIVDEYDSNLLINIDTASFLEWSIFFYGHYEPEVVQLIKRIFRAGYVAFDVGANVGVHSLIMGQWAGVDGQVIALEPNPTIYNRLVSNIGLNRLTNIQPLQCGLSNTNGEFTLYIAPDDFANQGMSSLYPQAALTHKVLIQVKILDEMIPALNLNRLDFIKIDTEGNEYNVLLGAEKSIQQYRPYILFEYDENTWSKSNSTYSECEQFFAKQNYTLYGLNPRNYLVPLKGKKPNSPNILAIP